MQVMDNEYIFSERKQLFFLLLASVVITGQMTVYCTNFSVYRVLTGEDYDDYYDNEECYLKNEFGWALSAGECTTRWFCFLFRPFVPALLSIRNTVCVCVCVCVCVLYLVFPT